jgi:hypothetical protein
MNIIRKITTAGIAALPTDCWLWSSSGGGGNVQRTESAASVPAHARNAAAVSLGQCCPDHVA